MKENVQYSKAAIAVTFLTLAVLFPGSLLLLRHETLPAIILAGVIAALLIGALWYAPISISLRGGVLSVNRSLRIKDIPVSEIVSARMCPPTMGARRICGSGGFFGYWGWFSEGDTGRYFAYYGKASDCFLITLRDGRKYMLGCKNAPTIVEALNREIAK